MDWFCFAVFCFSIIFLVVMYRTCVLLERRAALLERKVARYEALMPDYVRDLIRRKAEEDLQK